MSTRFVRIGSLDTNAGTEASPYATIAKAVAVAVSGDIIDIGAGLFTDTTGITLTKNLSFTGVKVNNDVADSVNNTIIRSSPTGSNNAFNSITTNISLSLANLIIDASGASTGNIVSINPSTTNAAGIFNATNVVFNGTATFNGLRLKNVVGGTIDNCIFPSTAAASKYGLLLDGAKNLTVSNSTLKLNTLGTIQVITSALNVNLASNNAFVNDRFIDVSLGDLTGVGLFNVANGITYGESTGAVIVPAGFGGFDYKSTPTSVALLTNNSNILRQAQFSTAYAAYVQHSITDVTQWYVNQGFKIATAIAAATTGHTINIGAGLFNVAALTVTNESLTFKGVKINNDINDSINNTVIKNTIAITGANVNIVMNDLILDASGASGSILSMTSAGGSFKANNVVFNGTSGLTGVSLASISGESVIDSCIFPSTAAANNYGLVLTGTQNVTVRNSTLKLNSLGTVRIATSALNVNLATGNAFVNDRFTDICGAFTYSSTAVLTDAAIMRIDTTVITYGKTEDAAMVTLPDAFVTGTEYRSVTGTALGAVTLLTNNSHIFRNNAFLTAYTSDAGFVKRAIATPTEWSVDSPFNVAQVLKVAPANSTITLGVGRFVQTQFTGILPIRSTVIGAERTLTVKGTRANDSETDYINNTIIEGKTIADWGIDIEMSNFTLQDVIYVHPVYTSGTASSYFSMYIGKGQVATSRPDISNVLVKNVKIVVPEDGSTGFTRGITTNSVDGLTFDGVEMNGLESTAMSLSSTKNCVIKNCKLPLSGKYNRLNETITISSHPASVDGRCVNIDMTLNNTFVANDFNEEISGNEFGVIAITRSGPEISNIQLPAIFNNNIKYIASTVSDVYISNAAIANHSKFITKYGATYVRQMLDIPNTLYVDNGHKINNAVAYASAGNTIILNKGLFQENMIISKPLTVIGTRGATDTSGDSTVITGFNEYPRITANNVTFKNAVFKTDASQTFYVFQAQGNAVAGEYVDITNMYMENIKFDGVKMGVGINGVNGVELSGCELPQISGVSTVKGGFSLALSSVKDLKLTNCIIPVSIWGSIGVFPTGETNADYQTRGIDLTSSTNKFVNRITTTDPIVGDISGLALINVQPGSGPAITFGVNDSAKSINLSSQLRYFLDISGATAWAISNLRNFTDISGYKEGNPGFPADFNISDMVTNAKYVYENGKLKATATPPIVVEVNGVPTTIAPIQADVVIPPAAGVTSFTVDILSNPATSEFVSAGENKPVLATEYTQSTGKTVVAAIQINATDATGQPKTDFATNPIALTLTLPNAVAGRNLQLYKVEPSTGALMVPQPSGYPVALTWQSGQVWTGLLTSLSTYVAVDPTFIYCVVEGTMIRTSRGDVPVEQLSSGDLVLTADGRAVAADIFVTKMNYTTGENAPYHIPARTFGSRQPNALTVSPRHAVQVRPGVWEIPEFATKRYPQIKQMARGKPVTYYHLRLPNYFTDNFVANGAVVESFAGDATKALPSGVPLFKFNSKLGGFVRYSPVAAKSKSCSA
jgi:hypothetical protein